VNNERKIHCSGTERENAERRGAMSPGAEAKYRALLPHFVFYNAYHANPVRQWLDAGLASASPVGTQVARPRLSAPLPRR
jgi:hypothetical protein